MAGLLKEGPNLVKWSLKVKKYSFQKLDSPVKFDFIFLEICFIWNWRFILSWGEAFMRVNGDVGWGDNHIKNCAEIFD
jgi:hypothetical protein